MQKLRSFEAASWRWDVVQSIMANDKLEAHHYRVDEIRDDAGEATYADER